MFGLFGRPAFDPKKIPDLSGKVIIITGANGGLGYQSLLHLAKHNPSNIYLCARTRSKYDAAMVGITAAVPNAAEFVKYLELDLASLASVKAAAQAFLAENDRLDILMNNAGIMAQPPGLTDEGYEIQFGTNHVGHFLFTRILLPLMESTASKPGSDVRIINLSSQAHMLVPKDRGFVPELCVTDMKDNNTWIRYGQSKLANILFTNQLAKRYPEITSVSMHPGGVKTNLAAAAMDDHPWITFLGWPLYRMLITPADVGAWTQTWACVAPVKGKKGVGGGSDKEVESGKYYIPVAKDGVARLGKFAKDEKLGQELWEWSVKEVERQGY